MRISDWSSDVCSSDLVGEAVSIPETVDLVNEEDAGSPLPSLVERPAHRLQKVAEVSRSLPFAKAAADQRAATAGCESPCVRGLPGPGRASKEQTAVHV